MKIIKVTQDSCTPCKSLSQFMESVELEAHEEINLSESEDMKNYAIETLGVMSTPQLLLVDEDNSVIERVIGVNFVEVENLFEKASE